MENTKQHENEILEWLKDESRIIYCIEQGTWNYVLVKLPLKDEYGIVYVSKYTECLKPYKNLEYQGFYRKGTAELYNAQYELRQWLSEEVYEERSGDNLRTCFETEVVEQVDMMIANLEKKIKPDESTLAIQEKQKGYAESLARQAYLKSSSAEFKCDSNYEAKYFEETILDYVMDKEKCVSNSATEYFENSKERFINEIVRNLRAKEIYTEFEKGGDEHLTAMRNIIASVEPTYKSVNVTVNIDEKELTFKYEAEKLRRDCGTEYSTWDIPAKDRCEFEKLFSHRDFKPENITKITYCRKVIYEKG